MKLLKKTYIVSLFFVGIFAVNAQIKLPKLISNGMVLQRDTNIKIWGWAQPNENISIHFLNNEYNISANKKGEWDLILSSLKAGGPYKMILTASNLIEIDNILIGDVWLASGQSNMSYEIYKSSKLYKDDIENSENTHIRQFQIPRDFNFKAPQKDVTHGEWVASNPKSVGNFSAVAYFFAQKQFEKHNIPIGIINSSVGGTPAQAWFPKDGLRQFPHYFDEIQFLKNDAFIIQIQDKNANNLKNWVKKTNTKDLGLQNNWKAKNIDDSDWNTLMLPGFWNKKIGNKQGAVWFRKNFHLKKAPIKKFIALNLGRISDADSVFVNGKFIGSTTHKYAIRNYKIPNNILTQGKNTITIRVLSYRSNGGFIKGNPRNLLINNQVVDLNNEWKFKLGTRSKALDRPIQLTWKPTGLYNAMISPLLNYKIKGAIWYQGEGNVRKAKEYKTLFPTLINNWRQAFQQGNFPFVFVQLANYLEPQKQPSESGWALLREAQMQTLKLPKTGMAVIIDIGEAYDIHPKNKKDVGYRLSYEAERIQGDTKNHPKTPMLKEHKIKGNMIELSFSNANLLKVLDNKPLTQFAIAGKDKKFVWAKAELKGSKIIVYNDTISNPVAVRYAWANNPDNVNLFSIYDMPISPFRTDSWDEQK
ncbi:MAG: sialate O-acetylesterase [Algibacter sp.]|uniref:sialate O-acetylesterase n=1 Tax=Algibacter sp. TaxID=1872428 RepID=UPI0026171C8A|nr:sialate O-acetylesterase [Algibacter sp.]MDG1731243.1 sialate O-acetylesterase [Algibacter sp.]MDG2178816.1 sialate O-acetylesterase [Algibacter sp.]